MALIRVDQKMRVRLPKHVSKKFKLKSKEILDVEIKGDEIHLSRPKNFEINSDPVIRDMVERPMHSKIKITGKLLEKWKEEMWNP